MPGRLQENVVSSEGKSKVGTSPEKPSSPGQSTQANL